MTQVPMKTFFFTLLCLLLVTESRGQDTTMAQATSFYEAKVLTPLRGALLRTKHQLDEYAGDPDAVENYNMQMADICAGLLMYDSALYYIQRELIHKEIRDQDLISYSFFFLMSKKPEVYKRFLDNVFFGKYNTDKTTGRKKFVRSELCMGYIEHKLVVGAYMRYEKNIRFKRRSEQDSVSNAYGELKKILSTLLDKQNAEWSVLNVKTPQYSKDGVVPTSAKIAVLRHYTGRVENLVEVMVEKRLVEVEKLIDQNDIENNISEDVDRYLITHGKPQRYGTVLKNNNGKLSVQAPHDNLQEIAKRRKLAGLNTIEEMIKAEEKYLEDREGLMDSPKGR